MLFDVSRQIVQSSGTALQKESLCLDCFTLKIKALQHFKRLLTIYQ